MFTNVYFILKFYVFTTLTEKQWKCKVCHRIYSSIQSLNQHMKVHDDSKGFKCDVCLKVFPSKSDFQRHYRTHTGEKSFVTENLLENLT